MQYLCQVLTDTHPKVQAAGQTALQEVMFACLPWQLYVIIPCL